MKMSPIIEIEELLKIMDNPDLIIFDVSNGKEARANYEVEHLKRAHYIDLNSELADIKDDPSIGGRHPLPSVHKFAQILTKFGISRNSHVIAYDDKNGSNAAARLWWMLTAAGHEKVQVLNGGFNQARKHNFPMSSKVEIPVPTQELYKIETWNLPLVDMNEVEKAAQNPAYVVVDVRDKDRYDGITEPIDLIAGHIPGAINIPFTENLDENGMFRSPSELKKKFETQLSVTKSENIIVHCGSGVTACHTLLALAYAGMEIPNLYVGSWSEWSRNAKPIGKTNLD